MQVFCYLNGCLSLTSANRLLQMYDYRCLDPTQTSLNQTLKSQSLHLNNNLMNSYGLRQERQEMQQILGYQNRFTKVTW